MKQKAEREHSAERTLRGLHRVLAARRACRHALVDARGEETLLREICANIAEHAGYRVARIDLAEGGAPGSERPVEAGNEDTGSICLPLRIDAGSLGNLYLQAPEEGGAFEEEELHWLSDLAGDIAFGVARLRAGSEKLRGEASLRASEEKYRQLMETANDAIFVANTDGIILEANQRAEKLLGLPADRIVGMHQTELHPKHEAERYAEIFREHIRTGRAIADDLYVVDSAGHPIPVQVSASTAEIGGQQLVQGIFRDMTDVRRTEDRLRQAQKMEAIGTLAGGIAHDFNNLLTPILGYAELALADLPRNSPAREDLTEILSAADRARDLIEQILAYTRGGEQHRRALRLQPVIREALRLLRASLPGTIEIRPRIDEACPAVLANPTQIHQLILNLGANAYHAMRDHGGTLGVTLKCIDRATSHGIASSPISEGSVELTLSDTGHGMDAQTRERIFEPYFTTKPRGEGTGLGLAVVLGIVNSHDALITVESEPGHGATFRIAFPAIEGRAEEEARRAGPSALGGNEALLLVDDDPNVLRMMQRILERLGYGVEIRAEAYSALAAVREAPERFDLIVSDQMMPGMMGTELARALLDLRPELPVLLCSGFKNDTNGDQAHLANVRGFLSKPVGHELARAVRRVLDAGTLEES